MKILITGSTSQQASQRAAERFPTFASMMAEALRRNGDEVDFVEPSFKFTKQYLSIYDLVLVGITPPTSMAANKVYPAFTIANRAHELGILALFIDAPEPFKIISSLKSCYTGRTDLFKDFYSKRTEYALAKSDSEAREEITNFTEFLYKNEWPLTIYPSLPWSDEFSLMQDVPNIAEDKLFGVNLDYQIFEETKELEPVSPQWWSVDVLNKYAKEISMTVRNPVMPVRDSAWQNGDVVDANINKSVGLIATVYRARAPWWTAYISKALALGKPVVTDWLHSGEIDPSWNYLASTVEEMSPEQRQELAVRQSEVYTQYIENSKENLFVAVEKAATQMDLAYN